MNDILAAASVIRVRQNPVLEAFRGESAALSQAVSKVSDAEWARATRCEPWTVRELLAHVTVVIDWLPLMLDGPAPDSPDVTATQYYRPDTRFSPQSNATRIDLARAHAADHAGPAAAFTETWQRAYRLCREEPRDRVVRTRHGDAMLLTEFLVTRVVEVAIHGLDIADALGHEPWLTAEAETVVLSLLIGGRETGLGWDGSTALRKLSGRATLTVAERGHLDQVGVNWITLG